MLFFIAMKIYAKNVMFIALLMVNQAIFDQAIAAIS
jgi:hypothetical protein